MAQKRHSSLADQQPPAPSSSEQDDDDEEEENEEEDSSSSEDEEQQHAPPPAPAPAPKKNPTPKKSPPALPSTKSQPPPSPSHSTTDSESGSEPESDHPPATANNPKETPKPKKPKPQPSASASKKRATENNQHSAAKKAKKIDEIPAAAEDGGGGGVKKLVWSEEDEIAILKGLVEFTAKTGVDPYKDVKAFHEFVKKSLRAEASFNQLKEKIRRLKKKFENNARKESNGEAPRFAKPHEEKAFELSKKVWANGGVEQEQEKLNANANANVNANAKPKKNQKEGSGSGSSGENLASKANKVEAVLQEKKEVKQKGVDENEGSSEIFRFDVVPGAFGLNEEVLKRGMRLIVESKRVELEERWKKLQFAELELYVKRAELIKDQAKLILEAYKSSKSNN